MRSSSKVKSLHIGTVERQRQPEAVIGPYFVVGDGIGEHQKGIASSVSTSVPVNEYAK